jgi:AGZA family xanthine/uracil permease-like MFS transporter
VSRLDLEPATDRPSYAWACRGDINAFFGLMLDNVGGMILMASLLVAGFKLPAPFVLTRMIPGTAAGVLFGDLVYTAMALRLARRTGRTDVTAMPLGLDTPSTFGAVLFIIGPAFQAVSERGLEPDLAARHAWFLGMSVLLASGLFKIACAPLSGWIRRLVPRAGLLGSLTAIALVLISFLPFVDIAAQPVAGMVALAVMLATLTARWRLPRAFPGALGAVLMGCLVFYVMKWMGWGDGIESASAGHSWALRASLPIPLEDWWSWLQGSWRDVLGALPIAIPLALATVVGGIDCTESASAAGDEYRTGQVIAVEGLATVFAGLFGGVIQSTPYIGHPAYKAMGARAAYTLATALFVGAAGIFGFFDAIFLLIPKAVIFPILIFIGLEITAQSFHATPVRHYPAVALACVPALAYLGVLAINQVLSGSGKPFDALPLENQRWIQTVTVLAGGGTFILTSLLWATMLANLIDGRVRAASAALLVGGALAFFGIIHSPLSSAPIAWPTTVIEQLREGGRYAATAGQTPYHWSAAYALSAVALLVLGRFGQPPDAKEPDPSEDRRRRGSIAN